MRKLFATNFTPLWMVVNSRPFYPISNVEFDEIVDVVCVMDRLSGSDFYIKPVTIDSHDCTIIYFRMNNNSITKERNSSFELLRILSMILVLVVHMDFLAIGNPTAEELSFLPIPTSLRVLFESIAICCVNVFVLISGWFGIKASFKGFLNFIFQCVFFAGLLICINAVTGLGDHIKPVALRTLTNMNWFVVSYIGLYILSPVLNAFVVKEEQKTVRNTLICLLLFEFIFGFATQFTTDYNLGYSILSFVNLYLLARYLSVYKPRFTGLSKIAYVGVFIACVISLFVIGMLLIKRLYLTIPEFFNYYNPIVIIESLSLLLLFSRLQIKSKIINIIAKSCFAVFLFHTHPFVGQAYLYPYVRSIYSSEMGAEKFGIYLLLIIAVFTTAVILDQGRVIMWKIISKRLKI